jgi:rubrerythrin
MSMELAKIYEYALQREQEGKRFFEQNAARFSHGAVVEAFQRLAGEEEQHIRFIERLLARLDAEEEQEPDPGVSLQGEGMFAERAANALLDQTIIESMVPDLSVLRTAYLIERDFAEFYEGAARQADDETARAALLSLAKWERGHERLFRQMHDKAFEEYAGMPWGG